MSLDRIRTHLERSERTIVITHRHADVDAIGSAMGLAATLEAVEIATPGGVQSEADVLLDDDFLIDAPDLESYDLQVVVDAPTSQRIAPVEPTPKTPLVVVDHHERGDIADRATVSHSKTDVPATAQLVAEILQGGPWTIPEHGATALAAGILDDTGFRATIMPDVQDDLLSLLEIAGEDSRRLSTLWETVPAWSERMATAKALVRSRGYKAGETILLVSQVGGEEAVAARALLAGNADIALVFSDRGDQIRVTGRTIEGAGLSLSLPEHVLQPLADEFGGHGGGHATAGTAKLDTDDVEPVEEHALQCVEDALGMQFGQFT